MYPRHQTPKNIRRATRGVIDPRTKKKFLYKRLYFMAPIHHDEAAISNVRFLSRDDLLFMMKRRRSAAIFDVCTLSVPRCSSRLTIKTVASQRSSAGVSRNHRRVADYLGRQRSGAAAVVDRKRKYTNGRCSYDPASRNHVRIATKRCEFTLCIISM